MQIKRHSEWSEPVCLEQREPVNKVRRSIPLKQQRQQAATAHQGWGFNTFQSESMMHIVHQGLKKRFTPLEKEIMDLEWAKSLKESAKYDSRKDYLKQFKEFWKKQEDELTVKITNLIDDIYFWGSQLEQAKVHCGQLLPAIDVYEHEAEQMLEQAVKFQSYLDFIKNDKGSLREALDNTELLHMDQNAEMPLL